LAIAVRVALSVASAMAASSGRSRSKPPKPGGETLCHGATAAIAAGQHLAAAGDAHHEGLHGGGDRLAQYLGRLVFQVCAVYEMLFDALLKHGRHDNRRTGNGM
jgi:hypothetical protein